MTNISVSNVTNTVVVTENSLSTTVSVPITSVVTATTKGPQGATGGIPTFIQTTQPTIGQLEDYTQYVWWDTSGGDLTLWIEDGTP